MVLAAHFTAVGPIVTTTVETVRFEAPVGQPALVLDCLFGYGQNGAPRGEAASLIERSAGLRTLALDVPSGLELETGVLHVPHVRAEATLTLACPKEGLRAAGAGEAAGTLYVADISVPALVYESLGVSYATPFGTSTIVRIEAKEEFDNGRPL